MATITGFDDIDDFLDGNPEADLIIGLGGNDTLFGNDGADTLDGGGGRDWLAGGAGNDLLLGGGGNDELQAGPGEDTLRGGLGNDFFTTDGLAPRTFLAVGGAGGDFFDIKEGDQGSIDGGAADFDTLRLYWTGGGAVTLTPDLATATGRTLLIAGIERFELTTGAGDDDITTDDTSDAISVSSGANRVNSAGGDDAVSYTVGAANTLDGGQGDGDILQAGVDGPQVLTFVVTGNTATDGFGSTISGFEVYDVRGGLRDDLISLGDRADLGRGTRGDDTLQGNGGNDRLFGGLGNDLVQGGQGRDVLYGARGADRLDGGDGNDILNVSRDNDTLTGGAGADWFMFNSNQVGFITITDFASGEDQLRLSSQKLSLGLPEGALDESRLSFGAAVGDDPQFVLSYDAASDTTRLVWAPAGDGPGGVYSIAIFTGVVTVEAQDIFII